VTHCVTDASDPRELTPAGRSRVTVARGTEPVQVRELLGDDFPALVEFSQSRLRVSDLSVYVPQHHAILQPASV